VHVPPGHLGAGDAADEIDCVIAADDPARQDDADPDFYFVRLAMCVRMKLRGERRCPRGCWRFSETVALTA
jgi:hypothetical protein